MFKAIILTLTIIILMFLKDTTSPAASFECQRAKAEVELMICKSPKLNDADTQLGNVYRKLRDSLSPADNKEVVREQQEWIVQRDSKCSSDDVACLLQMTVERTAMLNYRMSPRFTTSPTAKWSGRYRIENYMFMKVQPVSDDRVAIEINGAEPVNVSWICNFSGTGGLKNNVVTIPHDSEVIPIVFTFSDTAVAVSGEHLEYFCGAGGSIEGKYVKER